VKGEPIFQTGFVAHQQGLEAIEPSVHLFNDEASAVEVGVEQGVIVGLPVGRAPVAGDFGFDVTGGARLS